MDAEGRRGLMPRVKGREAVAKFFDTLPKEIEDKLLRGAARAGANVIAEEARSRTWSGDIRDGIKVRTQAADDRVSGKVTVVGQWPRSLAIWAEFGTSPHYISVDDSQRGGRTAARINQLEKAGTLVINGKPVGATVYHPGARAEPFMRPALDVSERAAIAAAQAYINARVTPGGIVGAADEGEEA